ncbi:phosphodiesterase/alkaline phosphatase D [Oleiphilus messinensis]|uniref:Phosphodiesterase/alkaline phosphatase D n=2 Tax=Oleiphilus messinensis TaxID=141451 RepID=A0A1Y0IF07_9GAMM|nr:phosphodiesterase/alkaline phosphatase D [Oleiphilus messinensis]
MISVNLNITAIGKQEQIQNTEQVKTTFKQATRMTQLTRRHFIKLSALGLGAAIVSSGLQGCSDDDDPITTRKVAFNHGIASGDPLNDRVIIWTRVTPIDDPDSAVTVSWEVASDEAFTNLLHNGSTETTSARDYTVKVDVQNLQPGTVYYYRFKTNGVTSATGKTKTLPQGSIDRVKLAVFSCANYPAGYFHVYGEAAKHSDLDAVVHLGDYFYEYGANGYATEDAETLGRTLPADNSGELLTLGDYRKRYALYRTDSDLQALHKGVPFIVVWDDHEVANDTWRDGAENHNESEGDFSQRKIQALQAYFEWMPIRPVQENDEETIYRSFQFGDLVDLHMLDTRIIGRVQQLDYGNYLDPATGSFNAPQFIADVSSTSRTLLGTEQLGWLQNTMLSSNAVWQVLGQQVLMGKMMIPAELIVQLANPDPGTTLALFAELAQIKGRILLGDPTVTDAERARVETVLPYNLDAWDGYAYEREVILATAKQANINLVTLAGDTHNAWGSELRDNNGDTVGVEFATASVSSPGLEEYLSLPPLPAVIRQTEQGLETLIDDLKYLNASQRGFLITTFTRSDAVAEWRFVSTVKSKLVSEDTSRRMTLKTQAGDNEHRLQPV